MLSLQDVLSLSPNASEEELRQKGLLPPVQPPTASSTAIGAPAIPAPAATPVAKMTPPVVGPPESARGSSNTRGLATPVHPNAPATPVASPNMPAPEVAPMTAPQNADMGVKPMTPPTLDFKQRQALPMTSAGVLPGSSEFYEGRLERAEDQKANPWGSQDNHPGAIGRVGHVLGRIGNIALDVAAPAEAALIPGTDLNKRAAENANERKLETAKQRETAEEAVRQRPEIAAAAGELKGQLEAEKEAAAQKRTETGTASKEKIAGEGNKTKEQIASESNETKTNIAAEQNKTKEQIAKERAESAERIATGHNLTATEVARLRAQSANDPDKLTNTMKTMKQQAQSTLPGIDRALDETERIAGKLGPVEGRWNEFWQGKVGANDPDYAHYKDEIALVSSAVTLAHARGRMSNELFEHFQKMFDAGKQAPENMIQALNVAKEWLTEYAKMGETPANNVAPKKHEGGGEAPKPPEGKVSVYDPQGKEHFVLKDKVDTFLKDPKYKGWSKSAPAKPGS